MTTLTDQRLRRAVVVPSPTPQPPQASPQHPRPRACGSEPALRILHLLHAMPIGMTRRELQSAAGITEHEASQAIIGLRYRGRVEAAGTGHLTRWKLTAKART